MHSSNCLYDVRRMCLTQADIWEPSEGVPVQVIRGASEELFVIGVVSRNNLTGAESFLPKRYGEHIGDAYYNEGYARHVCHNCNVPTWNDLWERIAEQDPATRSLLARIAAYYIVPGLDFARMQVQHVGYETALRELINGAKRAKRAERWSGGLTVSWIDERETVLINDDRAPCLDPPRLSIPLADLARLAFPDALQARAGNGEGRQ